MPRIGLENINPKDTHAINISVYKPNGISSLWSWFSRKNQNNIPSTVSNQANNYKIKLNVDDLNTLKLHGIDIQDFQNFKQDKKKPKNQNNVLIIPKNQLVIGENEFIKDSCKPIKEENSANSSKLYHKRLMSKSTISVTSKHNFINTSVKDVDTVKSQKSVNNSLTSSKASYKVGFKNSSSIPIQANHLNRSVLLKSVPTAILKSNIQKKVFIPLYVGKRKVDKTNKNNKSHTLDNFPSHQQEAKDDNNVIPMLLKKIKSMEEQISDIENKTNKINEAVSQNSVLKPFSTSNPSVNSKKNFPVTKGFAYHKVYSKKIKSVHPKRSRNKFTVPTAFNASKKKDLLFKIPNYNNNRVTSIDDGTHYNRQIFESPDIFFKQHNCRVSNNISKKPLCQTNPDVGCDVILKLFKAMSEAKESITTEKNTVTESSRNEGDTLNFITKPTFDWKHKSLTSASETQMERNKKNSDKNINYKIKKHSSIPITNKTINYKRRNELFNNIMTSHLQQNIIFELLGKECDHLQLTKTALTTGEPRIIKFQKNEEESEFCKVLTDEENKTSNTVELEGTYENNNCEHSFKEPMSQCNQISTENNVEPKLSTTLKQCKMLIENIPQISLHNSHFTKEKHETKANLFKEHENINAVNSQTTQYNKKCSEVGCYESKAKLSVLNNLDTILTDTTKYDCGSDKSMIHLNKNMETVLKKNTLEKPTATLKSNENKFNCALQTGQGLETLTVTTKEMIASETGSQHPLPSTNVENEPKVNITILVEDKLKDSVKLYSNITKAVDSPRDLGKSEIHNKNYCIVSENTLAQGENLDRVEHQKPNIISQDCFNTSLENQEEIIKNNTVTKHNEVTTSLLTSDVESDPQSKKKQAFCHSTDSLELSNTVDIDNFIFSCQGTYINHEKRKAYDEKLKGVVLSRSTVKDNLKVNSLEESCKELPITSSYNRFVCQSPSTSQENLCSENKHKVNIKTQNTCKSLESILQDNKIEDQFVTETTKSAKNFETNLKIKSREITTSCFSSIQTKQTKGENSHDYFGKKEYFFTVQDNYSSLITSQSPQEVKRRYCRSNMTLSKDPIPEEPSDKIINLKTSISDHQSEKGDNINIKANGNFYINVDDSDKVYESDILCNSTDTVEGKEKCLPNSVYTQTNWSLVGLTFDHFKHIYTTKNTVCIQTDVLMQQLNTLENKTDNFNKLCNKDIQQSGIVVDNPGSKDNEQSEATLSKYMDTSNEYKENRVTAVSDIEVQDDEKGIKRISSDVQKCNAQVNLYNITQPKDQEFQDSDKETICISYDDDIYKREKVTKQSKNKNPHHCSLPCFPFISGDTSDLPRTKTIYKNLTPLKKLQSVITLFPQIYNHKIYLMTTTVDFTEISSKPNTYCKIIPTIQKREDKSENNIARQFKSIYTECNQKSIDDKLLNLNN